MEKNLLHIFIKEKDNDSVSDSIIKCIEEKFDVKLISKVKARYLKDSYVYRFEYKVNPRCFRNNGERIYIGLFEGIYDTIYGSITQKIIS